MIQDKRDVVVSNNTNKSPSDLSNVIAQLWRGKKTIMLFIVGAIILAIIYLFIAKEKWTSSAIITRPDAGQIFSYNNAMNILTGSQTSSNSQQDDFFLRFSAAISALSETLDNQEEPEKLLIDPTIKGQPMPLKVSYTAKTAEEAQRKLAEYIQKVDDKVSQEVTYDLSMSINSKFKDLSTLLKTQESVAKEKKDERIAMIQQALTVAKQSNIQTPQPNQSDIITQDSMFLLGSEALETMVKNEAQRPLNFNDEFYRNREQYISLSGLKEQKFDLHAYRYVMKPTLPIHRDSPKKALVLLLAIMIGWIVGSVTVLGRSALKPQ
ncbi:MAG: LPS O-antigen chain length determinant protein WzzB [Enterobacteriaceae bacterium]|nr:LPS O-antigen chain length determinant protein WzzB [Enterobacteriaceae bacterium]